MKKPVNLTKITCLLREAGHSDGTISKIAVLIHQGEQEILRENMRQYLRKLQEEDYDDYGITRHMRSQVKRITQSNP